MGVGKRRTILAEHLASHDLLVEVSLTLLDTGREAFLLGLVDLGLDGIPLGTSRCLGLFLLGAELTALVPPQVSSELAFASSLVVEVGGVGCKGGNRVLAKGVLLAACVQRHEFLMGDAPMMAVAVVATVAVTIVDV